MTGRSGSRPRSRTSQPSADDALPHSRRAGRVRTRAPSPRRGGRAERPPPARHPPVALALLPAAARLRSGARGHRSRARALRGDRRHPSARRGATSRHRSSPTGWDAGCSRDARPRRHAISSTRSATRVTKAACSTTSPDLNHLTRERRGRDRAAPRGVRDLRRRAARGGGGLRPELARRDPSRAWRSR